MPATTTPTKQKAAAVADVKAKATRKEKPTQSDALVDATLKADHAAKLKAIADEKKNERWKGLTKGMRVKAGDITGEVSYRHTHEIDGEKIGMVGIKVDGQDVKLKGRSVKNISVRADACKIIK